MSSYNSDVPVSWATMESNPYNRDPTDACLSCTSTGRQPSHGTPAPPPMRGQPPCAACPNNTTFGQRRTVRDSGPPCCTTETYGSAAGQGQWPWTWGGDTMTMLPDATSTVPPELWQDAYEVKNRAATGFYLAPTFNPYVL